MSDCIVCLTIGINTELKEDKKTSKLKIGHFYKNYPFLNDLIGPYLGFSVKTGSFKS